LLERAVTAEEGLKLAHAQNIQYERDYKEVKAVFWKSREEVRKEACLAMGLGTDYTSLLRLVAVKEEERDELRGAVHDGSSSNDTPGSRKKRKTTAGDETLPEKGGELHAAVIKRDVG
jgi:hypothetical protein